MCRKKLELAGQKFGRLTVISEAGRDKFSRVLWNCECSCGNFKVVLGYNLNKGVTHSCGCISKERLKEINTTHRLHKHPLYQVWNDMKNRCFNPKK